MGIEGIRQQFLKAFIGRCMSKRDGMDSDNGLNINRTLGRNI